VLDGAVGIFCGVGGVEPQSETVWRQADRYRVPRIAYVNKLDRVGADFDHTVQMMRDRLGANPVPIQIPLGTGDDFSGVVDLVTQRAIVWEDQSLGANFEEREIPAHLADRAEKFREKVIEAAADFDEALMAQYLDGQVVAAEQIRKGLREATLRLRAVPVLCGASFRNKGVQPLLDAVVDYLPSPLDVPPVEGADPGTGETVQRKPDDNAPFAALVFKLMTDKHIGHLTYMRVYSGRVKTGDAVLNASRGRKERIGRLLLMHANKRQEIQEAFAGDIVAVVGLKAASTGETLCDPKHPVMLESMDFPEPVLSIAIEPKTKADMDRLATSLDRLVHEDPTFRVATDPETGQTIISGMGELHLEIITDRLLREFNVGANVGRPQVAYKETISVPVRAEGRYIKQTGGAGDYGVVVIEAAPGPAGSGFQFTDEIRGMAVPKQFVPAVRQGCEEALQSGAIAGYPVVDVRVRLVDGQAHDVDSSERSFKIAGSLATKDALRRGKPILLEPVMKVEVVTPEEFVGAVQGDLNSRRGRLTGIGVRGHLQVIDAEVPLATMFGYVNGLRSLTQGRATYTMQFSHYAAAPQPETAG
jgi:elongation factor G